MKTGDILAMTERLGDYEFLPGFHLQTSESMTEAQRSWRMSDPQKQLDFSIVPFWATRGGGRFLQSIADTDDLDDFLADVAAKKGESR